MHGGKYVAMKNVGWDCAPLHIAAKMAVDALPI